MFRGTAVACFITAALGAASAEARQADVILVGARVLTADPARPTAEAVAVVGERIQRVGSTEEIQRLRGAKTRVVDLRGRTVIPGLIDAHVHLLPASQIVDEPSLRRYEEASLPKVMTGFISHGITTVRSTGDPIPYITQLRDRMEQATTGPRLVVTGSLISAPGGHPATTICRNNPFCRNAGVLEVATEDQARRAVQGLARAQVNAVKIVVDDVIVKVPALSDQIIAAVVDESDRNGLRVVAHVSVAADVPATKRLIELGVDEFAHPPTERLEGADAKETIDLLARLKRPVTTTLAPFDAYKDANGEERTLMGGRPFTSGMRTQFDHLLGVVRHYADAGVKLVVGTDWFDRPIKLDDPRLQPGAYTLQEMDVLHRAGLSTPAILAAATRHAAEALQIVDQLGTISEGKLADLVILEGDLLQDFSALHRTAAVFKSGRLAHGSLP